MRFHTFLASLQPNLVQRWHIFLNREILTIKSFPFFVIFAVLLYFTALSIFSISIDDEFAAFRTEHEIWITQGRWTIYLFETLILTQTVVPYFSNLLFILFIVTSYLFVIRAYDLKVNFFTYALFPIFCAFPTWTFIAEFYANLPATGFALLLVSVATYLFSRCLWKIMINNERINYRSLGYLLLVPSIFVATAVGVYQSFILLFASMGLSIIVYFSLEQKMSFSKIAKAIILFSLLLVASLLIYYLIQCVALYLSNTSIEYIGNFYRPDLLLAEPIRVIGRTLSQMRNIYLGLPLLYDTSLMAIGFLMLLGLYMVFSNKNFTKNSILKKITIFLLVIAILMGPFALNILAGGTMPVRTFVGVPFVLWFFALLALIYSQALLRGLVVLLLIIGTLQIIYTHSLYSASILLTQKHDEMLASNIYQRIAEVNPDFDREKPYRVYFYGAKHMETIYPNPSSSTMASSFFSWDNGNPNRMVLYMKLIGINNLEPIDKSQYDKFAHYLVSMPVWPASGSVKVVDDVTLVKLGK